MSSEASPVRVTKRREQTRERLIEAAESVFARQGFGRSTVEQVCEEAGFTRGAFYSNFDSLDELFLAMWGRRSQQLLADLSTVIDGEDGAELATFDDAIDWIVGAVPVDGPWFRISSEFAAHALRSRGLVELIELREQSIVDTLRPVLERILERVGRHAADPDALIRALVAVHDGTTIQVLIASDPPTAQAQRAVLFRAVAQVYTTETGA